MQAITRVTRVSLPSGSASTSGPNAKDLYSIREQLKVPIQVGLIDLALWLVSKVMPV